MILIVSAQDDLSTNEVIDWIFYYKQSCLLHNSAKAAKTYIR